MLGSTVTRPFGKTLGITGKYSAGSSSLSKSSARVFADFSVPPNTTTVASFCKIGCKSSNSTSNLPFQPGSCVAVKVISSFTGVSKLPRAKLSIYSAPCCSYARNSSAVVRQNLSNPLQSVPSSNSSLISSCKSFWEAAARSLQFALSQTHKIVLSSA